jgi:hypothetical protein
MGTKLLLTDVASLKILRNVVKIVYILDTDIEVELRYQLDLMQNMQADLRLHHCNRLLVCYFQRHKEVCLLKLLQQLTESQTIDAEVLN